MTCSSGTGAAQPTTKSTSDDNIAVYGFGTQSCGTFSIAFQNDAFNSGMEIKDTVYYSKAAAIAEWVSGYISAANMRVPLERQMQVDTAGITLWLKRYCDINPMLRSSMRSTIFFLSTGSANKTFSGVGHSRLPGHRVSNDRQGQTELPRLR
jgi:hypothetical protein